MWWRSTTATSLGVSFGTDRRRRRDVLMGRCEYVPLGCLGAHHWAVVGCFIWDLLETLQRRIDETSLLRPLMTSSGGSNMTSWRHTTETSWQRSSKTSLGVNLRRAFNVAGTYTETSLRRRHDVLLLSGTGIQYCFKVVSR